MAKPRLHEQTALMQEETANKVFEGQRPVDPSKFNYKPRILRTWPLVAFLALTATLIGLLEFAVIALPHGNIRLPVDDDDLPNIHHGWHSMVPRQMPLNQTTSSSDSTPTSATAPGAFLQTSETYTPTAPHATPPGAFVQPTETFSDASGYYSPDETSTPIADSPTSDLEYIPVTPTVLESSTTSIFTGATPPAAYLASSVTYTTASSAYLGSSESYTSSATISSAYVDPSETVSTTTDTIISGATPGPAYDFNMAEQHDGKGVVVYTWTTAQVFVGTYLPVLVAVFYRSIWTVLHNSMALIDPFRQMARAQGARADQVLFSFYQSRSSVFDAAKALFRGRWALLSSACAVALTCILPALASEAIWVDTNWGCSNPKIGSNNPCPARMTIAVVVARVLQALLALFAAAILFLLLALPTQSTGLQRDPSSIASIAKLARHPSLEIDLSGVQDALKSGSRSAEKPMVGKKYRLGTWEDRSGMQCYGIRPVGDFGESSFSREWISVSPKVDTGYRPVDLGSPDVPPEDDRKATRLGFRDIALLFMIVGTFGVILAYFLDYRDDGFNRFFNSNTFGPRFILTGAGTIIVHFWKEIEHSTAVMAPFVRLASGPSSYSSTISFSPSITPFVATFQALRNRYWLVAAVTVVALSGEALNIVISGVPFSPGQMHSQFLVSAYMSLAILGLMSVVFAMVLIRRRQEARVPVPPYTLAAKMSYLVGTRLLDEIAALECQSEKACAGMSRLERSKCSLQQTMSSDGERRVIVDTAGDRPLERL